MQCVVLDANAIGVESPLGSVHHRALLDAAEKGELRLIVPRLTLDEALNRWREVTAKAVSQRRAAEDKLIALGALRDEDRASAIDLDDAARAVERRVTQELEDADAEIIEFPAVPHDQVVARALRREQPFDRNGHNGYRDVLVWETVLELARAGEDIVLVSDDGDAFGEGREGGTLAKRLGSEAERIADRPDPVRLVSSVRDAAEDLVESNDEILGSVRLLLQDEAFASELAERLETAVNGLELSSDEIRLFEFAAPVLTGRIEPTAGTIWMEFHYARQARSGEILVEGAAELLLDVAVSFPVAQYAAVAATESLGPIGLDADDSVARASVDCTGEFSFEAVIDLPEGLVVSLRPGGFEGFDLSD